MAATLTLITAQYFRSSRYADVAEQVDNIDTIIAQAEARIQRQLDRQLAKAQHTEILRPSSDRLFLRERPIITLDAVSRRTDHHDAWETLDTTQLDIEPDGAAGVIESHHNEFRGFEIKAVYTAGFDPMPADLQAAVVLQTVLLAYQNLAVFNAAGDRKNDGLDEIRKELDELIRPYRKVRLL